MRSCNKTFHIRFTDEEYEKLGDLAEFTGLTKSGVVRFMVAGISPREKPSEDYFNYCKEMHKVGNLLNKIARNLYYGQVDHKELDEALVLYKELSDRILTDNEHGKVDIKETIKIAQEQSVMEIEDQRSTHNQL
jgi:hypothetical protein